MSEDSKTLWTSVRRLRESVSCATMNQLGKKNNRVGVSEMKSDFRAAAKVCSGIIMILLVIGALGPAEWTPRTPFGWQMDHFVGYFVITLLVCVAWPRPFVVACVLVAVAVLLESLQAFTPHRSANPVAALCGAGGVVAAALIAKLFIRGWKSARNARGEFGSSTPPKP